MARQDLLILARFFMHITVEIVFCCEESWGGGGG